ncbi:pilus assembly FimT family protein [Kiloniella litopenaei]|uniref:pilus assembly FimT family protein n=1 Tax=Kiloniella litopenaei TaxID=1549748 RepID=UPI003BA9DFF6
MMRAFNPRRFRLRRHLGCASDRDGFSYIEALIVLAIMGLMFAVSMARTSNPEQILQKGRIVNEITQGLNLARAHAIKQGEVVDFEINLQQNRISLNSGHFEREFDTSISLSVVVAASQISQEETGAIQFYKDGSSTGGVITIHKDEVEKPLAVLRVDWLTGNVIVDVSR